MEDYSPNPSKSEEFLAAPQFWSYPVAQSLSLTAQDHDPGGCRNAAYWPASEFLQEGDHMSNRMLSEIYGGSRWMFPLANQLWSSYDSLPDLEAESDQIREDYQESMLQLVGSVDEGSSSEERYPYYVPVSQHACECHSLETEQMKKVWISSGIGSNDRHETGIHDQDYLGLDGNQREPPNKLRKLWDSQEIPTESQHCALNLQSTEKQRGMHKSSTLCSTTLAHSNLSSTKPASAFRNKPNETRNMPVDPQSVAARERRKRISERVRCLEKLIPGGSKMDTASMLDEAIRYVKFLQIQVNILESLGDSKNDSSLVLSEELQEALFRKRCCVAAISQSAK